MAKRTFASFIHCAVLSTATVLALSLAGCSPDRARVPGTPPDTLTIFYTCDTQGHIEPCGCASGQAGGITRRMTYLNSQASASSLLLDAGDVTAGARDWELFEMEYILRGYQEMGYDAVNAGHREASIKLSTLRELNEKYDFFVSTNLLDEEGDPVFPPYRIIDLEQNYRIGVLGVMADYLEGPEIGAGLKIMPPADAIARYLPELTAETDDIVLLAFVDEDEMKALAERFFEIDFIIGGNVLQPIRTPLRVNQSIIASITDKGKAIGRLDIAFNDGNKTVSTNDIFMLMDTMEEDPDVAEIVDEFKIKLADMDFQPHRDDEEGLTTITAARSKTANRYVEAQTCRQCHPKAFQTWRDSKHAHSFASLVDRGHQFNPRCLTCHTVGYGASDGYINQRLTSTLGQISCGNCHGRSDYHARFHAGGDVPERAAGLKSVDCVTCHDPENSPEFNLETYWEMIKHGKE